VSGPSGGRESPADGSLSTPPVAPWKVVHAAAAFLAGIGGSLLAAVAVAAGGITPFEAFAVVGPAQSLATIGVVALLRRYSRPAREELGFRFAPADGWGLLAGAGLQVALSLLLSLVVVVFFRGEAPVQDVVQIVDEAVGLGTRVAVVATAVFLAPVAEELVFRGILLRALARRFRPWTATIGSAGAFALGHLLDPNAALAVPALFLMGVVLARQVQVSARLGGAMAVHVGFNLLSVLFLFLA
jgi:membrane protease YdiL (CAAX protease family)